MKDKLTKEEVLHVAHLARIAVTEEEIKSYQVELKKLLDDVEKIGEIYTPIEYDEYFFQTNLDPFPLIRTYKYNSHNTRQNTYKYDCYLNLSLKNMQCS